LRKRVKIMSSLPRSKYEFPARTTPAPQQNDAAGSIRNGDTDTSPNLVNTLTEGIGAQPLSIALIGPNAERRSAVVMALADCGGSEVCEFSSYPPGLDDVPRMLEENYDVIMVELDSDPEYALDLVENIGSNGAATVMVYSSSADPELLVRCMRSGAREFLTLPLGRDAMAEALVRAAARRPLTRKAYRNKPAGRLLTFMGAKGGAGATMLACNFAVALAQDPSQKTLLIDLDLPLGDAALNLGIVAEFSSIDALRAADRLDEQFLSQLLVKHSSGVWVLAAPGRFVEYHAGNEDIEQLIRVARAEFDNVVVDMGSKLDLMESCAYRDATAVYLVTQSSIPELRNSNRLISQFFSGHAPKLEVVINRYASRSLGVSDQHIAKALTRPVQWKIPNDYAMVRKMQINATPLVLEDSPITRQIRQMAKAVMEESADPAGNSDAPARKKGFRLF
jgi:pilus assembly protein CpaE